MLLQRAVWNMPAGMQYEAGVVAEAAGKILVAVPAGHARQLRSAGLRLCEIVPVVNLCIYLFVYLRNCCSCEGSHFSIQHHQQAAVIV